MNKIKELDIIKAFAILAVLLIHATAEATVEIPWGSRSSLLYVSINRLSVFAVPLFIMLNGLVLFYQYHQSFHAGLLKQYYWKRFRYLVIPYICWSFLYDIFYQWLYTGKVQFDLVKFGQALVWADIGYHLYFMVIIIQFAIMFPLLMFMVKTFKMTGTALLLFGFIVQALFYSFHHWIHPVPHTATIMLNYIAVFCAGGAVGMNYEKLLKVSHHLWWTFALGIGTGFVYLILIIEANNGMYVWPLLEEVLFNSYPIWLGLSFIWIANLILRSRFAKPLILMGSLSFGIYLTHPALLSLWRYYFHNSTFITLYHVQTLLSFIIIIVIPACLVLLARKFKWSWVFFGR